MRHNGFLLIGVILLGLSTTTSRSLSQALSDHLTPTDLKAPTWSGGLVDNRAFLPTDAAHAAQEDFAGTLELSEIEMSTEPAAFKSRNILGKDPKIFPAATLSFFTHTGDLVPTTQDVIRYGSSSRGRSYWDVIVQPGRIWWEPGDGAWSRASFPFALVNSLEGETHNGVATFLYKGQEVSNLHFQIVQQTTPFYVTDYFTASGNAPVKFHAGSPGNIHELTSLYEKALADSVVIKPWADLAAKIGGGRLEGFDSAIKPGEIVLDGLSIDGIFYLKSCRSAAGELAYCDRQRFGVWSATKAAANAVALLRLAEKYGPRIFDAKIADYVKEAANYPAWRSVTFGDALNMATGLGNGSTKSDPNAIFDGYLDEAYPQWYEARSEQAKIDALLKVAKPYPWGPGKVARYRDQDMFLLGVAMNRLLQAKEGPDADLWTMLQKEVYAPIGIHYAPTNRTIEDDGGRGQPLMAFGFYPTLGDLLKIAQLFENHGRRGGIQILNAEKLNDILPSRYARGLSTGDPNQPFYRKALWHSAYRSQSGCTIFYPKMMGWGGNYVMLLPHDLIALRVAKSWNDEPASSDVSSLAAVADRLTNFCD